MKTWRDCKLGDLLQIKHGFAFLGEHFGSTGTHVVLTPGNFLEEGGFKERSDKAKWYSGPIPDDYVLNEGDLIVAMTEQAEGLLGSSALIPRSGVYLHNQRLGLVQIRDRKQADQHFIYYLFNSKPVRQQIRGSASGTKIRHTAPSRIADVKVSVPPLPVQRRIAGILSAYDELMENSQRRIRLPAHAYTEDQLVEQPAIGLFAELGWTTVSALEETFGATGTLLRETKGEVVLVSRLRAALERLNPALPPEAITAAVDELTRDRSAMSLEAGQVNLNTN
jgi:hypothetical protein